MSVTGPAIMESYVLCCTFGAVLQRGQLVDAILNLRQQVFRVNVERTLLLFQKLDRLFALLCSVLHIRSIGMVVFLHFFVKDSSKVALVGQVGLRYLLGEFNEAGDHLLLLIGDVQDDVKFVDDVPDFTLELGLWSDVEEGEKEFWVHLVLDA